MKIFVAVLLMLTILTGCEPEKEIQVRAIRATVVRIERVIRYAQEDRLRVYYMELGGSRREFSEDDILPQDSMNYRLGFSYVMRINR